MDSDALIGILAWVVAGTVIWFVLVSVAVVLFFVSTWRYIARENKRMDDPWHRGGRR